MIKRLSSCLFFLLLPTLIIMGPILTGISPASAHDEEDMSEEDMSEEIEPPRLRKKDLQTKSRKSASSSKSSRKRYVKEDEEDNEEEDDDGDGDDEEEEDEEDQDEKEHTVLHRILWYVPNRLLDVADIARARFRVGPGVALNGKRSFHPVHDLSPGIPPETLSSAKKKSGADELKYDLPWDPAGNGSLAKARTSGWLGLC